MAKTSEEKAAAKAAKAAATSGVVTVTWRGGTREFSEAVHGENFGELAQEFAGKFNGTIA